MGFWDELQADESSAIGQARSFDPANRSANTGINGGMAGPAVGSLGTTPMMNPTAGGFDPSSGTPAGGVHLDASGQAVSGGGPMGAGQQWDQNYFTSQFGTPGSPQELEALEQKITAAGGKVIRNAAGVAGKIQTPDGRVIDVINSAGAGGKGFQWLEGGGGGAGGGGGYGFGGFGSFVTPMSEFTPPSAEDAMNSPGTQYSINEAMRMMQNSAAAKGTLLNGRTLQAELGAITNLAAGQYGDVYNRAANTFGINYGVKTGNQDRPFDKYYKLGELGQRAVGQS